MAKLTIIGDRLHNMNPSVAADLYAGKTDFLFEMAEKQISAGANYLNISTGSDEQSTPLMAWIVPLLQQRFDAVPLSINSDRFETIEAGLKVYDARRGMAVVNSADASGRMNFLELAADYHAKCICMCMKNDFPITESERVAFCSDMFERGLSLGIAPRDMLFDIVAVPVKTHQERIPEVLKAVRQITEIGLRTVCAVSNVSVGLPNELRPMIEAPFTAMAISQGLSAALLNPCCARLLQGVVGAEVLTNDILFSEANFVRLLNNPDEC